MKFRVALLAAAIAAPVAAEDAGFFRAIDFNVSLQRDASLMVTEKADIENDSNAAGTVKRMYWTDADEKVQVVRIVPPVPYKLEPWGQLQLTVPPGRADYVITTRVTGAVTPVWGIPRGVRATGLTAAGGIEDRIREILDLWRNNRAHARSRYLVDYQYFFPEQAQGMPLGPSISFGDEWVPADRIQPGEVGTIVKGDPDSYHIRHLFDYKAPGVPASINFRAHAIRIGSIVGFPILAAFVWFIYFRWARPNGDTTSRIDEPWLRDHIFNEPPEIIGTQWRGYASAPDIEQFLRRLEKEGKIALDVETLNEGTENEDIRVTVRLRVDRKKLSEYERTVIDSLMPDSDEITSEDIEKAHAGTDFDPMEAANEWLGRAFPETTVRSLRVPAPLRAVTLTLMGLGAALLIADVVRTHHEPFALLVTFIVTNFLVVISTTFGSPRRILQLSLIPLLLLFAVIIVVHTMTPEPAGEFASLGVLAFTLGGFHGIVSNVTKRDRRPAKLVEAHDWFEKQLRSAPAHIPDGWLPYLDAFGLKTPKALPEREKWGFKLCTFAD